MIKLYGDSREIQVAGDQNVGAGLLAKAVCQLKCI
jgi:hypothetical protein